MKIKMAVVAAACVLGPCALARAQGVLNEEGARAAGLLAAEIAKSKPHSRQTGYMSAEGWLRLKLREKTGQWNTLDQSHAILLQAAPTVYGGRKDQEWKSLVALACSMPDGKAPVAVAERPPSTLAAPSQEPSPAGLRVSEPPPTSDPKGSASAPKPQSLGQKLKGAWEGFIRWLFPPKGGRPADSLP